MLEIKLKNKEFKKEVEEYVNTKYKTNMTFQEVQMLFDVYILNKEKYVVEDIQDYIENSKYKPDNMPFKISIINNFEKIDRKIQNKLLKLYEEDRDYHLILTNNKSSILPTIISRAIEIENKIKIKNFEKYPNRYQNVLHILPENILVDEKKTDIYLKTYDNFINKQYSEIFLKLTTQYNDYDEKIIYEIIQLSAIENNLNLEDIIELQTKLSSRSIKKMQIENFILQQIKKDKMENRGKNK